MITFKYTKLSNQFFFISNLADWHYSCRKHYNDVWLKDNPLTQSEKQAIEKIKPVLCKYSFGEKSVVKAFFQDNKQWEHLVETTNKKEYKILQDIFQIFQERFDQIWESEEKKIKKWKELLENSEAIKSKEIIKDIKSFLGAKADPKIKVYLLINPCVDRGVGGGANEGKNKISIEVSNVTHKKLSRTISVLFHEVAHVYQREYANALVKKYIEEKSLQKKYKKIRPDLLKQKFSIYPLFSETIIGFLFNSYWEGTLTAKHLQHSKNKKFSEPNFTNKLQTISDILSLSIEMAGPKIKEYLENGKKIDEGLLEFIWENFEKMNLRRKQLRNLAE